MIIGAREASYEDQAIQMKDILGIHYPIGTKLMVDNGRQGDKRRLFESVVIGDYIHYILVKVPTKSNYSYVEAVNKRDIACHDVRVKEIK